MSVSALPGATSLPGGCRQYPAPPPTTPLTPVTHGHTVAGPHTLPTANTCKHRNAAGTALRRPPGAPTADVGCRARVKMPVMNAELSNLQAELSALDAQTDPEDVGLPPNIGEALAAEMVITCAAS